MFILIEIVIIILTYYYLIKQYNYIRKHNTKQQEHSKIFKEAQKEATLQNIVVSNMTAIIDQHALDKEINHPTLYFYLDNKEIKSVSLCGEKTFIGRGMSDDIFINEPTVSRSQCFITKETDKYYINLSKMNNPISINKIKCTKEKAELSDGDLVSMGNGKICFVFQM